MGKNSNSDSFCSNKYGRIIFCEFILFFSSGHEIVLFIRYLYSKRHRFYCEYFWLTLKLHIWVSRLSFFFFSKSPLVIQTQTSCFPFLFVYVRFQLYWKFLAWYGTEVIFFNLKNIEFQLYLQIFELIAFVCTLVSDKSVGTVETACFITGAVIFGLTTLFLLLFLFRIDNFVTVNWAKIEMVFTIIASYTFLLISTLIVRDTDELLMTASVSINNDYWLLFFKKMCANLIAIAFQL